MILSDGTLSPLLCTSPELDDTNQPWWDKKVHSVTAEDIEQLCREPNLENEVLQRCEQHEHEMAEKELRFVCQHWFKDCNPILERVNSLPSMNDRTWMMLRVAKEIHDGTYWSRESGERLQFLKQHGANYLLCADHMFVQQLKLEIRMAENSYEYYREMAIDPDDTM